jgi:hypothetical protein
MRRLFILSLVLVAAALPAQKQVYIPQEWRQGQFDYSFERSAESDNFIVFWGPKAAEDPRMSSPDIAFDPDFILNTAEELYRFYIDDMQFVPGDTGLITQWKMILVLLHTWEGIEGWAFGGNYDGVTGAMWMHPHAAQNGPTLAHEFTHALQNYTWMMYPGHGFINHSYVGFFWEAHAEFMAMQRYPEIARYFDISRWMNTSQFHWSSTRHHYQAFMFLQYLKETEGIELIHRMWRESLIGEHPLQTLMRLTGKSQEQLNDAFGDYARRNVNWDYENGDLLREAERALPDVFRLNPTVIPDSIGDQIYRIQDHRAPQDYGYNIIRIVPQIPDSCEQKQLFLKFQGITENNPDGGWRYSLVAINKEGVSRFSPLYQEEGEQSFEWMDDDSLCYLVVSGAPGVHHNYDWEIGFPKIYRYPYTFRLVNAIPHGYEEGFRQVNVNVPGSPHPNGGGFVASTAYAAETAYVGKHTQVLDRARVEGEARLEGKAVLRHDAVLKDSARVSDYVMVGENAIVEGNARVAGFSRVWGGCRISDDASVVGHSCLFGTQVYEHAQVTDNTFCWGAALHGDVLLGGDAEYFRPCDKGIYLQVQGAYGRDCDGLTDHPANVEVNGSYNWPDESTLAFTINTDCASVVQVLDIEKALMAKIFPNPVTEILSIEARDEGEWLLLSGQGYALSSGKLQIGLTPVSLNQIPPGLYLIQLSVGGRTQTLRVQKQ